MNAGMLRHRIIIQKIDSTVLDECGASIPQYVDWKKVWAAVEPLRGKEYLEAQKIRAETTYRIKIRYLNGITTNMQILFEDKILDIQNIIEINKQKKEIHLMCIERVKNNEH